MSDETDQRPSSKEVWTKAAEAQNAAVEKGVLPMWTIYDHPFDVPDKFVARMWEVSAQAPKPTGQALFSEKIEDLRKAFEWMGLYRLPRELNDDPVIVETWL